MLKLTIRDTYPRLTLTVPDYDQAIDITKKILLHSDSKVSIEISRMAAGDGK